MAQAELDRFCETLISIRKEIADIESGKVDRYLTSPSIAFLPSAMPWQYNVVPPA